MFRATASVNPPKAGLMMLRYVRLATRGVLARWNHTNQLHHTAILMRQNVAMEDIGTRKIDELVTNPHPSRDNLTVDAHTPGEGTHILPDAVVRRRIGVIGSLA